MASTSSKKKTKAPVYSADAMVMRYLLGILLVAFGALVFLSVVMDLRGSLFAGVRTFSGGIAGSLQYLLPVPLAWGGVLMMFSAQRKANVRPLLLVCGILVTFMGLIHLFSSSGNPPVPLMKHFLETNRAIYPSPAAFDAFLSRAYELGAKTGMGGGLLGMILAWLLWTTVGEILGIVLLAALLLLQVVLMLKLDFNQIFSFVNRNKSGRAVNQAVDQQDDAGMEDLAWQQQQAAVRNGGYTGQPAYPRGQPTYQSAPAVSNGGNPHGYAPQLTPSYPQQQPARRQPAASTMAHTRVPSGNTHGFQPAQDEKFQVVQPGFYMENVAGAATVPTDAMVPSVQSGTLPRPVSKLIDKLGRKRAPEPQPMEPAQPHYRSADDYLQRHGGMRSPARAPVQPAASSMYPADSELDMSSWESAFDEDTLQFMAEAEAEATEDAPYAPPYRPITPPVVPVNGSADVYDVDEYPYEGDQRKRSHVSSKSANAHGGHLTPEIQHHQELTERASSPMSHLVVSPAAIENPAPAAYAVPQLQNPPLANSWQPALNLPEKERADQDAPPVKEEKPYLYPQMVLLKMPEPPSAVAAEEDAFRARRLEETLQSFKIPSQVRHITHGPSISRFELEIASGIKVNRVTDLDRNIAMNMEVKSVRIEAPIPGKSLVGVEVPNRKVTPVTLREVLETEEMQNAKSPLTVALGKDIAGAPILCDLARMPHLLIAGATGSGKSVCVNAMINSLLFRCSPKEVRMILIDPKVVELQCYNGIPHLLIPVVSDPHKAAGALEWAVTEMMDRYKKFQLAGVREINGYNADLSPDEEKMPRIVIIIDELADLMMTCKKDVEERICRLAQLARAAGIHLVVATQRPSVDVITGLIKANIPSRIAFKVSSFIDSRTIMDRPGAEKLLGYGDMLYLPNGEFTPTRIQGCFLTDGEVNRITDFIRAHCESSYDPDVMEQLERIQNEANNEAVIPEDEAAGEGSLLAQVIEMTVQDGQVSTSLIQRRFSVGYARAGRLVDEMEKRGIVSQKDGAKPRMCLISREEFNDMLQSGALNSPL